MYYAFTETLLFIIFCALCSFFLFVPFLVPSVSSCLCRLLALFPHIFSFSYVSFLPSPCFSSLSLPFFFLLSKSRDDLEFSCNLSLALFLVIILFVFVFKIDICLFSPQVYGFVFCVPVMFLTFPFTFVSLICSRFNRVIHRNFEQVSDAEVIYQKRLRMARAEAEKGTGAATRKEIEDEAARLLSKAKLSDDPSVPFSVPPSFSSSPAQGKKRRETTTKKKGKIERTKERGAGAKLSKEEMNANWDEL